MHSLAIKKIKYASRRGMLELDVLFDRFWRILETEGFDLSDEEWQSFEKLLSDSDAQLWDYFFNEVPCEDVGCRHLIQKIQEWCAKGSLAQ